MLLFLYAYLTTSWNLVGGFAGVLPLGHATFVGIGAYTSTILALQYGISPWIGMIIAILLYARNLKVPVWVVLDNMGICSGITATFIRLGNLMNSEIIGKVTDVSWAFIFERVDQYPRHPGQLYEAISYACFFLIIYYLYRRHREKVGTGFFFGLCLTLIFIARFLIEYTKDIQVDFESGMLLDMGQILSIPFIIIGIATMVGGKWMKKLGAK